MIILDAAKREIKASIFCNPFDCQSAPQFVVPVYMGTCNTVGNKMYLRIPGNVEEINAHQVLVTGLYARIQGSCIYPTFSLRCRKVFAIGVNIRAKNPEMAFYS